VSRAILVSGSGGGSQCHKNCDCARVRHTTVMYSWPIISTSDSKGTTPFSCQGVRICHLGKFGSETKDLRQMCNWAGMDHAFLFFQLSTWSPASILYDLVKCSRSLPRLLHNLHFCGFVTSTNCGADTAFYGQRSWEIAPVYDFWLFVHCSQ